LQSSSKKDPDILLKSTEETCGKRKKRRRKIWFDEECEEKVKYGQHLKLKWLQDQSEETKQEYRRIHEFKTKQLNF
jgi:hypothetical protein